MVFSFCCLSGSVLKSRFRRTARSAEVSFYQGFSRKASPFALLDPFPITPLITILTWLAKRAIGYCEKAES